MLLKRADDRIDDVAVCAIAAFHMDVGRGISRPALGGEALERAFGILCAQPWAGIAPRRAIGEDFDRRIEPDRDRLLIEQLPGAWLDEGIAPGGDDADVSVHQARNDAPLAVAIIVFPKPLEDLRGGQAGRVLDGRVAIDEGQAEPLRQPPADRRLASPHQADEDDWTVETLGEFMHARAIQRWPRSAKAPSESAAAKDEAQTMPKIVVLIIALVLVVGGLILLSTSAREVPVTTIETDVSQGPDAR